MIVVYKRVHEQCKASLMRAACAIDFRDQQERINHVAVSFLTLHIYTAAKELSDPHLSIATVACLYARHHLGF